MRNVLQAGGARLDASDAIELARRCRRVHFQAGTVLYAPDLGPEQVVVIDEGRIEVTEPVGTRRRVVELLGRCDIAGDIFILLHEPPSVTARCIEQTSGWAISAGDFTDLLDENPRLTRVWLRNVAGRLARKRTQVVHLVGQNLRARLAQLISAQAVDGELRVPQRTLASLLGVQRSSVNRNLKDLEAQGVIELRYGKILVTDPVAIARIAAQGNLGPRH